MTRERLLRIVSKLLHPITQLRRMHPKVLRCLRIGYAPILDQADRLELELSRKLPSFHLPPPVPSNTFLGVHETGSSSVQPVHRHRLIRFHSHECGPKITAQVSDGRSV